MVDAIGIPLDQANRLREEYFRNYGTTLNGLIANYQTDPQEYMAYVHDIPTEDMLAPDPDLKRLLEQIRMKKVIFTNADRAHSERVLSALGVNGLIDQIVDYFSIAPSNKPELSAYSRALTLAECEQAACSIMVDDQVRNLIPAQELGMKTVLVNPQVQSNQFDWQVANIKQFLSSQFASPEDPESDA
jgi:putative hydrolase of the HAD superfamily